MERGLNVDVETGDSVAAESLSLPKRLCLALLSCLASDLTYQTDAVQLVRIDGPDSNYSATLAEPDAVEAYSAGPVR
jgi:hypothetical protein